MRSIRTALFGAFALLSWTPTSSVAAPPPLTVAIKSCAPATVTGFIGAYPGGAAGQMRQFLGIPYAKPPLNAKRWMPPETMCWSNNRSALVFGSQCPQPSGFGSEDCLFLNVFTNASAPVSNQPVMVFIHGGALVSGSGSFQLNPAPLVAQGVVVVTINYRLGALGFLAH